MKRIVLFAALFAAGTASAQMSDPMRPPQAVATSAGPVSGPVLQSVVIGKDRRYAIISGEKVVPGGAFGEAKVVQIMDNQVTLRDAAGDIVLKLYPQVEKIAATKKVSGDAVRGEKGRQ